MVEIRFISLAVAPIAQLGQQVKCMTTGNSPIGVGVDECPPPYVDPKLKQILDCVTRSRTLNALFQWIISLFGRLYARGRSEKNRFVFPSTSIQKIQSNLR